MGGPRVYLAIVLIVVGILIVLGARVRSRPMSPEQFADAVRQKIARDYPEIKVKSSDGLDWQVDFSGEPRQIYLSNTYLKCRADPSHFDEIVEGFLLSMGSMEDTRSLSWEVAKNRVFPALKPLAYFEETRGLKGAAELVDKLLVYDYKSGVKIMIMVDSEHVMRGASTDDLKLWKISKSQLLDQSITNLGKLTGPHWAEATRLAREKNLFVFGTQDGYDVSRILLPDFYERASRALGCDRIGVGIPNRDCLIAFRATDPELVSRFKAKVATDYQEYPYPVCPRLFFLPEEAGGQGE